MQDVAIRVEHLAKRYRLGSDAPYHLLTESLGHLARKPFRLARRLARTASTSGSSVEPQASPPRRPELWALHDVSFEVGHGEVLGIIGRNGAGKSTLLKILSRITEPTAGRAVLRGRVGSLLEVGTGFHPELTGRENIYLNGAILGMRRHEVNARFDEIVAFAELESFLDTPVKRYSSGMVTRLGFAVAAHLEPEILIVDEVLAVGDVGFQKKCLGKMTDVARGGRTVLFVSHNMSAVISLCTRALWLDEGRIRDAGATTDVVARYYSENRHATMSLRERTDRGGNGRVRIAAVEVCGVGGEGGDGGRDGAASASMPMPDEPVAIDLTMETPDAQPAPQLRARATVCDAFGTPLFSCATRLIAADVASFPSGGVLRFHVPRLPLAPGVYHLNVCAYVNGHHADSIDQALTFQVADNDVFGSGQTPRNRNHGSIIVPHSVEVIR